MQCVGTLSWGIAPLTMGRTGGRSGGAAAGRVLAGRQSVVAAGTRFDAAGAGSDTDSGRLARHTGTRCTSFSGVAPASRRGHTEVRALEQDWTQIVRRSIDGDSGAWAEMVRTHQKRVYGLCYRFTGNAADAEDLTQDVFLKIYMNLGSFDATRGSLPVWITTMTRNLLVDNFRRTRNQRATSSLDDGWDQADELRPHRSAADRLADAGPSPHESAARSELQKMVQRALKKVSVELREAVILRDLQDLDYKEIAQVLGIPEGTVKSRISRGRAELARLLERNKKEVM